MYHEILSMQRCRNSISNLRVVKPIYERSGDPNNITLQFAYVLFPQGPPYSTSTLHGIFTGHGPTVYVSIYIYATGTSIDVAISVITFSMSKTYSGMCNLYHVRSAIGIGIFVLLSVSDLI